MKLISLLLAFVFLIVSCGSNMVINGKEKTTIGLINIIVDDDSVMERKDPSIKYRPIWGNIIWGSILFATIIAPIYFFGFSMFEPVGVRDK